MDKDRFELWLLKKYNNTHVVSDAISRSKRIEEGLNINLDHEYDNDRCKHILEMLEYSKEDEEFNKSTPNGIIIKGNLYNGMASLRNAIRKYIKFRQSRI